MPISIKYRYALENGRNAQQIKNLLTSNDFNLGWNFQVCDRRNIVSFETLPNTSSDNNIDTYIFDANMYRNPLYKACMVDQTKYVGRWNKVEELCELYSADDEVIDKEELMSIISYIDADPDKCVARRFTGGDMLEVGTSAWYLCEQKGGYFGLGNAVDSPWGIIPI